MPLITAAIITAGIGAGAAVVGDATSYLGQQSANETSMGIAQMNNQTQIDLANTAMQRRVGDLKAAGLNPVLAAGGQGAAVPQMMMPQIGNPAGAFGQLGQQANSALSQLQLPSQIDLNHAQAANARSAAARIDFETDVKLPQEVENLKADQGLTNSQAQQVQANLRLIDSSVANTDQDTLLKRVQAQLTGQNADVVRATKAALIEIQNNAATASRYQLPGLENQARFDSSAFGSFIYGLDRTLQPVGTAVGAASKAVGALKGTSMLPAVGYGGRAPPY